LVVLLLSIAEAMMLVVGCLLVDFLNLWCHIVAEAVSGFHRLVVGDIRSVGFAFVAEVVAMGGG
jgi:hypothetical protein